MTAAACYMLSHRKTAVASSSKPSEASAEPSLEGTDVVVLAYEYVWVPQRRRRSDHYKIQLKLVNGYNRRISGRATAVFTYDSRRDRHKYADNHRFFKAAAIQLR